MGIISSTKSYQIQQGIRIDTMRVFLLLLFFAISLSSAKMYLVEKTDNKNTTKQSPQVGFPIIPRGRRVDYRADAFSEMVTGSYTCKGKTSRGKFKVRGKHWHIFKTNDGGKYGNNVKCDVKYIRMDSCKKMRIYCNKFDLEGNDFLLIRKRGRKARKWTKSRQYTKSKGPKEFTTKQHVRIVFRTNSENTG